MCRMKSTTLNRLIAAGRATPASGDLLALGAPPGRRPSHRTSQALAKLRGFDARCAAVVLVLGLSVPTQAWGEARLRVFEQYVTDISTPAAVLVPPFGFFAPSDPTLVFSERDEIPIGPHDDHTDGFLAFDNIYEDRFKVNGGRTFGCPIGTIGTDGIVGCAFAPQPGHSGAFASGWANAGLLSFGVHSEAFDHGAESRNGEAIADASVRNRLTISPGSSGLPVGAPVRLRWNFRFKGSQDVGGRTFPNRGSALATIRLEAGISRGFCIPSPEGGCFPPAAASVNLFAESQAGPVNPLLFPGQTGSITESRRWSARNNLGFDVGDSDSSDIVFRDENVTMPTPGAVSGGFGFSTGLFELDTALAPIGLPFLDFEATVGERLEFQADAFTFAIFGGFGSARNAFFGTFESGIVDPDNRGLEIALEITEAPAEPELARCPRGQGFWMNHAAAWPVMSLTLGSVPYTQAQLMATLRTPTRDDASLILARQLMAAKLNLANGSDPAPLSATIAAADGALGLNPLPQNVKPSSPTGQAMLSSKNVLDQYNNGALTPTCAP
jgi:hypothetical protein